MYKVKNFNSPNPYDLQEEVRKWVESRQHIRIVSVNIWGDETHQALIIYTERDYNL